VLINSVGSTAIRVSFGGSQVQAARQDENLVKSKS